MASGDAVVNILDEMPGPQTLFPQMVNRVGGSTPKELVKTWAFNSGTVEYKDYLCVLNGYGGGGLTFDIFWTGNTQTSGTVQWEIAIRRVADDAEDIDVSHTYVFTNNTVSVTTASVAGEVDYAQITVSDGTDMNDWADDEIAVVRIRRNGAGTDTLTGDAELWGWIGRET